MANNSELKTAIAAVIKTNGNNEITGQLLQNALFSIINQLGAGAQYMGLATIATDPGTPDGNQFYLATTPGTYPGFGNYVLNPGVGVVVLRNNGASGAWVGTQLNIPTISDLRSVAAGQNATSFYSGGYVTSGDNVGGIIIPDDPALHKYIRLSVMPGQKWIYISSVAETLNTFITADGQRLNNVNFAVVKGQNEITIPDGAAEMAITMEFSPNNDPSAKWGDYTQCYLSLETAFMQDIYAALATINSQINDIYGKLAEVSALSYKNINMLSVPWKDGITDLTKISKSLYQQQQNLVSSGFYTDAANRFNLKCFQMVGNPTAAYCNYPLWKVYPSNFIGFDFSEKIDITICAGGIYKNANNAEAGLQVFVAVYYGVDDAYIQSRTGYDLKTSTTKLSYIPNLQDGAAIANNPDKNFAATIGGNLGISGLRNFSIPIYPTIQDGNGNTLAFSGLTISSPDEGFSGSVALVNPITYNNYPVAVALGKLSILSPMQYPLSADDTDAPLPASYLLDENGKIKRSLLPDVGSTDIDINVGTSDKIAFYGCSYTESYYAIKNKSWVNKLSNLLDLPLANFGVSGNRIVDESNRLRANSNPYGTVGIRELRPSHIAIQNIGNETLHTMDGGTLALYMAQVLEMVENVKCVGAQPILGTDHRIQNPAIDTLLKEYADKHGFVYCPISTISEKVLQGKYPGFWGGGHPATRTNESMVEEWFHILRHLHVKQSVKIFRVRDEYATTVTDVSGLNYDTLVDRLTKFVEINVGELALSEGNDSWKYYDDLSDTSKYNVDSNQNEYCLLLAGSTLTFNKWGLLEFVSPRIKPGAAQITIKGSAGLTFYVKNANNPVTPYSISRNNGMFQVTKAVYDAFNETIGTAFTSTATGATQIQYAGKFRGVDYPGYFLCFDMATTGQAGAGTLTKVSGGATTAYSRCYYNLSQYTAGFFAQAGQPVAGFEPIAAQYENGEYVIDVSDYKYWEYDKLRIIVGGSGSFTLGAPNCTVSGGLEKADRHDICQIKEAGEMELTEDTGFGGATWNDVWTKDAGIIFEQLPSDIRDYPGFNSYLSDAVLTQADPGFSNKLSKSFTIEASRGYRKMIVKVTARLYPKIYNQTTNDDYRTTTRQITPTSYDYGRLVVGAKFNNQYIPSVHTAIVGIGWAEKQFELIVPPFATTVVLELYRNPDDFDQAFTKAQTFPMQINDISVSLKQTV